MPLWPSKLQSQLSMAVNDSDPSPWTVAKTASPVLPSGAVMVGGYTAVSVPVRPDPVSVSSFNSATSESPDSVVPRGSVTTFDVWV